MISMKCKGETLQLIGHSGNRMLTWFLKSANEVRHAGILSSIILQAEPMKKPNLLPFVKDTSWFAGEPAKYF